MKYELGKILVGFIFSIIALAFLTLITVYPITILIGLGIYICWEVGDNLFKNVEDKHENNK